MNCPVSFSPLFIRYFTSPPALSHTNGRSKNISALFSGNDGLMILLFHGDDDDAAAAQFKSHLLYTLSPPSRALSISLFLVISGESRSLILSPHWKMSVLLLQLFCVPTP